jgi:hypothetical protein
MPLFGGGRGIRATRGGGFRVELASWERDVLRTLPAQLRDLLSTDDPALERLFPPAYLKDTDGERNEEYRRLMRGDLLASHQGALDVLEATVDATELDEEQLAAWMGALNDLRLVLGTRLDVSEDMDDEPFAEDDPRAEAFTLYRYLSELQWMVVEALSTAL